MNKKERNAMFKIHDDKVYFVAETPDINKVIEIFLPKDDRGTITKPCRSAARKRKPTPKPVERIPKSGLANL